MLTKNELERLCDRLNLSKQARHEIFQIRTSEPSRRVGGGSRNVSGRFPSLKMGVTIQFESHKVELPYIYQLEHDENVLEFYDQPPAIKLDCLSTSKRQFSFFYTPDFFVIAKDEIGWIECKTVEQLKKLAEKNPNRYCLGSDDKWHCPPAEAYAERLGFSFRVWSDDEINWALQRNTSFLEDFYACYLDKEAAEFLVEKSAENTILSLVSAQPGMSLSQLLHHAQGTEPDDIYFLIAAEKIYVDLMATPLVEPERCFVFRDRQTALAYKAMLFSQTNTDSISSPIVDLSPGKSVCWDGKAMKIIFVGETEILLQGEDNFHCRVELPVFEQLVQAGKIVGIKVQPQDNLSSEAMELLLKASEIDLKEANRRYRCIEPRLRGEPFEEGSVPQRTLRYWYAKYCQAQQRYSYGFVGLLSFNSLKGNSNPKLPKHLTEQIEKFIEEKYETHKQMGKGHVYGLFVDSCITDGIPEEQVPSYKTFLRKLKQRSGYEQTRKREGSRAAYSQEPFYLELELTTPRHGDRSFEIGHIDHLSTGQNLENL